MLGAGVDTTGETRRLVAGRAAWWIPVPAASTIASDTDKFDAEFRVEDTQKLSFGDAFKDLLANLSFHCYGKLVEHGRLFQERFFWFLFHITALNILIAFLWNSYQHAEPVLLTTIYNSAYPIWMVQYPAVSVCSLNRISKEAIDRYAEHLRARDPWQRNISYFHKELIGFGFLYYTPDEFVDYDRVLTFQSFLDMYDTEPEEMFFNTRRRLHALTPNCSETVVSCQLRGAPFDCQQHFKQTLTSHGFCCTLNADGSFVNQSNLGRSNFGADMGLVLKLKAPTRDDFYKLHPVDGFLVIVYGINQYPDRNSGGIAQRLVVSGMVTNLPITGEIFETVPEARSLSPMMRNCFFDDEVPSIAKYSFSKCISWCRARSILSLCACVPFYLPLRYSDGVDGRVFCTLQHVECLRRYRFKWLNVITRRDNVKGLEHELEDALYCPTCLPSCTETKYNVGSMTLALSSLNKQMTEGIRNNSHGNKSELSVVRIYFAQTHIQYFRQIINNSWSQTFSTIGNICGIIAGFSLIGICELVFFLAKQLWHAWLTEVRAEMKAVDCSTKSKKARQGRKKSQKQQPEQLDKMELLILP